MCGILASGGAARRGARADDEVVEAGVVAAALDVAVGDQAGRGQRGAVFSERDEQWAAADPGRWGRWGGCGYGASFASAGPPGSSRVSTCRGAASSTTGPVTAPGPDRQSVQSLLSQRLLHTD